MRAVAARRIARELSRRGRAATVRTPPSALEALSHELRHAAAAGVPSRWWSADEAPNPYLGLLAWADYAVVSPDSVNMASEACGASIPVYVDRPHLCRRRLAAFHDGLLRAGRTRPWPPPGGGLEPPERWRTVAPEGGGDAQRAAGRVLQMLAERRAAAL